MDKFFKELNEELEEKNDIGYYVILAMTVICALMCVIGFIASLFWRN